MAYTRLPEIHLINLWLLGERFKPIIIRDADKPFTEYCPERLLLY